MTRTEFHIQTCRLFLVVLFTLLCAITVFGKSDDDVVILKNGDRMTGEIKQLSRGELKFKADT